MDRINSLMVIFVLFVLGLTLDVPFAGAEANEKADVLAVLVQYERCWNEGDVDGIVQLLHKDGIYLVGREKKEYNKDLYINFLRRNIKGKIRFVFPSVEINQQGAVVYTYLETRNGRIDTVFRLVHEEVWLIIGWKY